MQVELFTVEYRNAARVLQWDSSMERRGQRTRRKCRKQRGTKKRGPIRLRFPCLSRPSSCLVQSFQLMGEWWERGGTNHRKCNRHTNEPESVISPSLVHGNVKRGKVIRYGLRDRYSVIRGLNCYLRKAGRRPCHGNRAEVENTTNGHSLDVFFPLIAQD